MGRVIICADVCFPHGDPGANRILYVAQALDLKKREVYVLSHKSVDADSLVEDGKYKSIKCMTFKKGGGKVGHFIYRKLLGGKSCVRLLKEIGSSEADIVYIYGNNALFVKPIIDFCRKKGIKTYIDVVEWHQSYQYTGGKYSLQFQALDYTYKHLVKKADGVIAISNCIAEHFKNYGGAVHILPPLIDTSLQTPSYEVENTDKINIIYPGNPISKDDILTMLKGLSLLDETELSHISFHSTGITEKTLRDYLGAEQGIIDKLKGTIVFHGFMPYSELCKLYQNMDFVYMSRFVNLVTEANFPSKIPEIMAWGIVPVCNRVGDYHFYLKDSEDAILFDGNTPNACRNALARALALPETEIIRMKKNARLCAEMKFDYNLWAERVNLMFQ